MDKAAKKRAKPLDPEKLHDLALRYVARYATTRAKLLRYLGRKLKERGWDGDAAPDIEQLADRFVDLGYIDDAAFAEAKAASLSRAGYGARRVGQALFAAGIGEDDGAGARQLADREAWASATTYARKKRIGPFAAAAADPDRRRKQLQAMLRAGHGFAMARRLVEAAPGENPDWEDDAGRLYGSDEDPSD